MLNNKRSNKQVMAKSEPLILLPKGYKSLLDTNNTNNTTIDKQQVMDMSKEYEYAKLLYSQKAKIILPYVSLVLNEYEYDGSPVYERYVDKQTVFVMATKVYEMLKNDDNFKDIIEKNDDNTRVYLYSMIEAVLLNELFMNRRPKYEKEGLIKPETPEDKE